MSKIKVIVVEPNKKPYVKEVNNKLEDLQEIVGGYIEVVSLGYPFLLVCNEEGKILGLQPNGSMGNDIICGTFFITADTSESEFRSLNDNEIKRIMEKY